MAKEIEIPEGYEARIEGNKVIFELKESEDERIRKSLLGHLKECRNQCRSEVMLGEYAKWITYLEKQKDEAQRQFNLGIQAGREEVMYEMEKEQQPAEWGEEDKRNLYNTIEAIKYVYDVSEGSSGSRLIAWLKFHLRPQSHWKPSEEQMKALNEVANDGVLLDLFNDLLKLL